MDPKRSPWQAPMVRPLVEAADALNSPSVGSDGEIMYGGSAPV